MSNVLSTSTPASKLKGRPACETHDCYPGERYPSGRVKTVKWVAKEPDDDDAEEVTSK